MNAPSLGLKNSIYLLAKPDCLHIRFLLGPSRKENGYEIIELNIGDYVSPERSCRIEDIVNAIPHVLESTLDPVTNLLKVKAHRGMVTSNYVVKELRQCAIACSLRVITALFLESRLCRGHSSLQRPWRSYSSQQ